MMNEFKLEDGQITVHKSSTATAENKQPEYFGSFMLNGVLHKVALWVQTAKSSGNKYFGGKVQVAPKPDAESDTPASETSATNDLPF